MLNGDDKADFAWPVPPEPFALTIGNAARFSSDDECLTAMRHMGLRPQEIGRRELDELVSARQWIEPAMWRLNFGNVSMLAGRGNSAALNHSDPVHTDNSLLSTSLPGDWRTRKSCWIFIPEFAGGTAYPSTQTTLREFFKMTVMLIDLFDASHFFWAPARLWSDAAQLRASISEMLTSGMPPVLHLVAFRRREQAGADHVTTRGLSLFGGQELSGRVPDGWDMATMVRRMARLSLDIMLNGPVRSDRRFVGMHAGEWVEMRLDPKPADAPQIIQISFGSDG